MNRVYPAVMTVTHAHSHNDGGAAILSHLSEKYRVVLREGQRYAPYTILTNYIDKQRERRDRRETLVLESPYPATAASICDLVKIAPQDVTHSLVIIDAATLQHDPTGASVKHVMRMNGATSVGIGNSWVFDPPSHFEESFDRLGERMIRLVAYVEQVIGLPVAFIATSPFTVIDREPFPVHEQNEGTTNDDA